MTRLVALDLDGTLTQHKSKLEPVCRDILYELSSRYKLLMLCAGGCGRVHRQLDGFPIDIIGYYGMEWSIVENNDLKIIYETQVEADRFEIERRIKYLRETLGFNEYDGNTVEFHNSGIITFPLIGTGAPLDKKLSFDPARTLRKECYGKVCEVFSEYNVFIGGSSSFDIAPKPFCKLFALEEYLSKSGYIRSETIYFGDDYGTGGNDSDIYNSDIRFVPIDNYREFPRIAKEALL